jgi:transcription initiation factor TFIID TATA-box-binding protein
MGKICFKKVSFVKFIYRGNFPTEGMLMAKKFTIGKPTYSIVNMVASANLELDLDLYSIAYKVHDVEYEPEQFPGAIFKMKEPKSSLLLFKNGKIICTGCKSEKEVLAAIEKTQKMLLNFTKSKAKKGKPQFTIENIVASASMNVELDLYSIAYKVKDVEYEPEQFPGAIFKLKEPKSSLLLFKNGKIICTGCKSEKEVEKALDQTAKIMTPYASPLVEKK